MQTAATAALKIFPVPQVIHENKQENAFVTWIN